MKKELHPVHDNVTCDVCGRTILKGERTESFLAPGGQRRRVCELCFGRAEQEGWIRESVAGETPTRVPREQPRRSLLGRLKRRRRDELGNGTPGRVEAEVAFSLEQQPALAAEPPHGEPEPAERAEPPRSRPKDPRHVRAVPTTAEVKVERALELFNGSEHARTVSGLARTLGVPWVSATPDAAQPSAVTVVVAWELSWYVFRVDLGDEADPVEMMEKGEELDQLEESLQDWNAAMDADGQLVSGAVAGEGGAE